MKSPDLRPLCGLRLVLVGPGRVGRSLASWAITRGADLVGVVGRPGSPASSSFAEAKGSRSLAPGEVPASTDVVLLAVPDPVLGEVARELARTPLPAGAVLHVSGAHDASVLQPLRDVGIATGSLHPLLAFSRPLPTPPDRPLWFAVDGAPAAEAAARRLAEAFGARCFHISGERRLVYHLAATLAAGGVATVALLAGRLAGAAGLPTEVFGAYLDLAHGALERLGEATPPRSGLTGPAARGDVSLLVRELAALEAVDPSSSAFVRELLSTTAQEALGTTHPDLARSVAETLREAGRKGAHRPPRRLDHP